MNATDSRDELRKTVDYAAAAKVVRKWARGDVLLGAFLVLSGVSSPVNILLIVFGSILLIEGVVGLIRPSANNALVDGATCFVAGVWSLIYAGGAPTQEDGGPTGALVLGVWLLIIAYWWFRRYRRYAPALKERPTDEAFALLKESANAVASAPEQDENIIAFKTDCFFWKKHSWKGMLLEDWVFVVRGEAKEVGCLDKQKLKLPTSDRKRNRAMVTVRFRVGEKTRPARIPSESFERLKTWKDGPAPEAPDANPAIARAVLESSPEPAMVRAVLESSPEQADDIIAFKTPGFFWKKHSWKGMLLEDRILVVLSSGKKAMFIDKQDLVLPKRPKDPYSRSVRAKIHVPSSSSAWAKMYTWNDSLTATMPRESFERLQLWMEGPT